MSNLPEEKEETGFSGDRDDDNDHDVAMSERGRGRAPTSQRRHAALEEAGVAGTPLSRKSQDDVLGGSGRRGKRPDKIADARRRRRRLS